MILRTSPPFLVYKIQSCFGVIMCQKTAETRYIVSAGFWRERRKEMVRESRNRSKSSRKRDQTCCMHTAWGLVADCAFPPFWLWLSLSLGNSAQAERRGGRELRNGTEMGNKKNDRDRPRPGSRFWNRDGNEMVLCYQFNWKLESSLLLPVKTRVEKRMRVMGKGGEKKG